MQGTHHTVLLHEAVDGLRLAPGDHALDATLGSGGHTRLMAAAVAPGGRVLALEADEQLLAKTEAALRAEGAVVEVVAGNFRDLMHHATKAGMRDVAGILFDLGWNTEQLASGRGFSFNADEPLIMTYGTTVGADTLTAEKVVNTWSEADLAEVLHELGEERAARRIARAIVEARATKRIERATELRDIVEQAVSKGKRTWRVHPATKTFQALRMVVNGELSALQSALPQALTLLAHGGRLGVITFHSIEDRIVKRVFQAFVKEGHATAVTKKPIVPTHDEVVHNRRARSAKLRIIEKI